MPKELQKRTYKPTIRDIARAAGVSPTTVSHALNDLGSVNPRTRSNIKRIAEEHGYRPNLRAQRLRMGQSKSIALLSSMPFAVAGGPSRLGFLMEIAASAAEKAFDQNLALILVPPKDGTTGLINDLDIDGAIVCEPVADDAYIKQLVQRDIRVVTIGRQPENNQTLPYVDLQAGVTTKLLLEHFHVQGSRQIALIIGKQQRHSYIDAQAAYSAFIRQHDLEPIVMEADETDGERGGYHACEQLFRKHPGIDALCVPVDAFAVGAVAALKDAGRRIPTDIMVATRYDGVRAQTCDPPLTAVALYLEHVAALAVERLLAAIRGQTGANIVTGPEPQLLIRASSQRRKVSP